MKIRQLRIKDISYNDKTLEKKELFYRKFYFKVNIISI